MAAAFGVVVLAGCGVAPSPSQPRPERPAPAPTAPVGIPPATGGGQATNPAEVDGLLVGIRQARQNVKGFTGTVVTFEDGPKGKANETLEIAFKKPSTLKIKVAKSSGGNEGTQLLWHGGEECKVKPSYLPFAVSIKMSDERLLGKNNWEIGQTEVNSILTVILDPSSRLKALGDQAHDGKTLAMIELVSPLTPKGGAREVVGIDKVTKLPGVRMIYDAKGKLIYRLTIKQLTMKTPSAKDLDI